MEWRVWTVIFICKNRLKILQKPVDAEKKVWYSIRVVEDKVEYPLSPRRKWATVGYDSNTFDLIVDSLPIHFFYGGAKPLAI